jgi:hypothetical protein
MDDFIYSLLNDNEADILEDEEGLRVLAVALITGVEVARQEHINNRHLNRLYLCRSQLLSNPRENTLWQVLYKSQSDRTFITTMGLDVPTFGYLLTFGFSKCWYDTRIPREDVNTHGTPHASRRSLDAAGALGLVLHDLNSTMHEISLQQIFALIPTTVSRYITFALQILLFTLRDVRDAIIQWPWGDDFECYSSLVVACHR